MAVGCAFSGALVPTSSITPHSNQKGQIARLNLVKWVYSMQGVLIGGKKKCCGTSFPKKARGHSMCSTMVGGGWRWGGGWRLAVGNWRLVAVGGGWWLAVGGGWRLMGVGGWRLVVPWVGP